MTCDGGRWRPSALSTKSSRATSKNHTSSVKGPATGRARERDPETALHQVAAIEVAELGGDQAVDEPPEHQDAEEIATLDVVPALPEEPCPADGPDGE